MSASVLTSRTINAGQTGAVAGVRQHDKVIFISILVLTALVAVPYGTVEPWWIALYEVSIFTVGAFFAITNLGASLGTSTSASPADVRNSFALPQAIVKSLWAAPSLFLAFIFVQGYISADPLETRLTLFKLLALLTHAVLLYRYTSNTRRLKAVIFTLVVIAVVSSIFGIARHELQHGEVGFLLPLLKRDTGFAQFVNKNHFALLVEMSLGLTTGLILAGGVKKQFIALLGAAIIVMWTGLILTSSRGALFSMFGQLAFVITLSFWLKRRRRIAASVAVAICALVLVGVSAVWMGGDLLTTRLESLSGEIRVEANDLHAGVKRVEIWNATWQLFKQHPITGSGFGAYAVAITKFHDASGKWTPEAAHNDYLELLATSGIIGTALVILFSFAFISLSRKQLRSQDTFRRAACLGALTGVVGVVLHNFVDFGLHVTANSVAFVTLIVVATKNVGAVTRLSRGSLHQ